MSSNANLQFNMDSYAKYGLPYFFLKSNKYSDPLCSL